jgi:hypothetical protein
MSQGEGLRELVTPELKKDRVIRELWTRARRRAKEDWDTKDLLAEAISRVIDPDDMPGDQSKDFVGHMTFGRSRDRDRRMHLVVSQFSTATAHAAFRS